MGSRSRDVVFNQDKKVKDYKRKQQPKIAIFELSSPQQVTDEELEIADEIQIPPDNDDEDNDTEDDVLAQEDNN